MAVTSRELTTPEQDVAVTTRKKPRESNGDESVAAELAAIRDRIEAARSLVPAAKDRHCFDCFRRGRDAAIALIEDRTKQ